MRVMFAVLLSCWWTGHAAAQDAPRFQWQFTPPHAQGNAFKAQAGKLDASIVGPVRFSADQPKTLLLDGNPKTKPRLEISKDIAKLGLPTKTLTVEAWVRVDKTQQWGGIIGAFQDNGPYEKGWLLGFHHSQFNFAVASKGDKNKQLTYLNARTQFQTGFWYHVVGTYDGAEQRIYVDGQLQGVSKAQSGEIDFPPRAFFTIGAYHDDNELYPLTGRLERVSVFDRALLAKEIAARFQERKGLFPDMDPVVPKVADWPTYNRDNLRLGITEQKLVFPLKLQWSHRTRFPPKPAWPEEAKHDYYHAKYDLSERVAFDRAFHLVGVGDRVLFGSSADHRVYCLDADTGQERWSFCTEGPVRLAPTIVEDRVLFGSDDGHVYCVGARDGALAWKQRLAPDPRRIPGNERIISAWPVRTDVLVEEGKGYVCAGVFPSQGVYQCTLDLKGGKVLEKQKINVTAQGYLQRLGGKLHVSTGRNPAGAFVSQLKRLGREIGREVNQLEKDYPYAFIGAGDVRIAGGDGKIAAFRAEDGKHVWSAKVEGRVYSLAVVRGRLLASTDRGFIYCFAANVKEIVKITPPVVEDPIWSDLSVRANTVIAAQSIVKQSGFDQGYCLLLGSGDGKLAHELAKRTRGQIIGVEPDAGLVAQSRKMLTAAGLADRVAIHHGPLEKLPYPDCLFNLVIKDSLRVSGAFEGELTEAKRVLRPEGGVLILALDDKTYRRPALAGAGEWSHMYADPGNTACSNDQLVQGELQLQWFGHPSARSMIDRHHRTVPPLYKNGWLIVPGEDRILLVDAYNGTIRWDKEFKDSRRIAAFRDCSYLAAAQGALYVAAGNHCFAIHPDSGRTQRTFSLPEKAKHDWGYLAAVGDVLVGSAVKPGSIRREQSQKLTQTETHWDFVAMVCSDMIFARQRRGDKVHWTYRPKAGLILNPSIAIADEKVYFLESTNPATFQKETGRLKLEELVGKGSTLKALDLKTGKEIWQRDGKAFAPFQHIVFTLAAQGKVVIVGTRNSGTDKKRDHVIYDIHVFDAKTGEPVWSKEQHNADLINGEHGEQDRHPVIIGDKLYCEPRAYGLHTGKPLEWNWPWAKQRRGCGTLSASANGFFCRDENVVTFDLASGKARPLTTETRPGCWINLLPAGGLLLAPEASSGCTCNFSVQTSLALVPVRKK